MTNGDSEDRTRLAGILLALMAAGLMALACASAGPARLPQVAAPQASPGLVPQDFLCPGEGPQDRVDPQLAQEIQAFLTESSLFRDAPAGIQSQLPVVLNQPVRSYIKYFSGSGKDSFRAALARSGRYLPMMRRILHEHGLPTELAYLALIESGFNPWARSPKEAVGPWQFIAGTARRYGLRVNHQMDERRDPEKSTRAAARYLKDLHRQFGCWYLAAAGYNAGEKRVEGAVRRTASQDFWTLAAQGQLPQETCNFVPQLVAAALIARNPERYGFTRLAYHRPLSQEKVKVPAGADLKRFAALIEVSLDDLREFNPELQQWVAPSQPEGYLLKVPLHKAREARRLARIVRQEAQVSHRQGPGRPPAGE